MPLPAPESRISILTPWYQFFESLMQSTEHQMAMKPCFEVYLNDGNQDGYWDIDMYIAVEPVVK